MNEISILSTFTKKLSVLIFEKNKNIYDKFNNYLEKIFFKVHYTQFQEDIFNIIEEEEIDLLFIDFTTQDKDSGFTLIKNLRKKNPYVKTIIYSKYIDNYILQNCIRYNVSGFLTMDDSILELKSYIKTCIEKILVTKDNKIDHLENKNHTIIDCFNYLSEKKDSKVTVVVQYKGVPIIRESLIIYYDEKSITIKLDMIVLKTLRKKEPVVLSSSYLGQDIFTEVESIDEDKCHISLKIINFIDSFVHHRKNPRVEPDETSQLTVLTNNRKFKTNIINISYDHLLCDIKNYNDFELQETVNLEIIVTTKINPIKAKGIVKDLFNTSKGFKMLLKLETDKIASMKIEKYIIYRTKEIIHELKTTKHTVIS